MTESHNIDNSLLPYDIVLVNFIDKLIPHKKIQYDFFVSKTSHLHFFMPFNQVLLILFSCLFGKNWLL